MTKIVQKYTCSAFMLLSIWLFQLLSSFACMAEVVSKDGYKHYKFGISENNIRNSSKEEIEVAFAQLFNEISEIHHIKIKIQTYPNSNQLGLALKNDEIQGFFGTTLETLRSENYLNLNHIFTVKLNEKPKERYFILVRKDGHFNSLADLKNKKLAYSLGDEVGIAYLNSLIQEKKLGSLTQFFSQTIKKNGSGITSNSVFFKEAEAALVLESDYAIACELNPQLKQQLVAIETSPEYIVNIIAFKKGMSNEESLAFDQIITEATRYKKAQKLFRMVRANSVQKIDLNSIENMKSLINQHSPENAN